MGTIAYLPPKNDKGKLPLFCGNGEQINPIYGVDSSPPANEISYTM